MILLGPTDFWDGKQLTHLIDRKVASTLAAEANGASMAYDRSMYVRALCAEIETPSTNMLLRVQDQSGKQPARRYHFV